MSCLLNDGARRRYLDGFERRLLTHTTHRTSGRRVSYRTAITLQARLLAAHLQGRGDYEPITWR